MFWILVQVAQVPDPPQEKLHYSHPLHRSGDGAPQAQPRPSVPPRRAHTLLGPGTRPSSGRTTLRPPALHMLDMLGEGITILCTKCSMKEGSLRRLFEVKVARVCHRMHRLSLRSQEPISSPAVFQGIWPAGDG